ncbi:MAG: ribonuclease III domain-containing protein, partial [Planctomycetota bacterium]|nr:ribonuclease III domain-containing protein [Planctomycetota bacterium]
MPTQETLDAAQQVLGYQFNDQEILAEALRHASSADSRLTSNERLEFLGDSVLGLIVCEHLYRTYPDLLEGDLTKIKSVAVSRRTCAKIA